jgi:hypothetical protein
MLKKEKIMRIVSICLLLYLVFNGTLFSILFADEGGKLVIVSDKVGEAIDKEERERYNLFPQIKGFKSAIFLKLQDGSYVAEVTYEEEGEEKKQLIPQSANAFISVIATIDGLSTGTIRSFTLTDGNTIQGKLVSISEHVGASIDEHERNTYALFENIQDFERALFFQKKQGDYFVAIQTKNDTLLSFVRDTALVSILHDYIERYPTIKKNRLSFENKWLILGYDEQGLPITDHEIRKSYKPSTCWGYSGAVGGGAAGFLISAFAMAAHNMGADKSDTGTVPVIGATILGIGAGYYIGNRIGESWIDIGSVIVTIRMSRTPK